MQNAIVYWARRDFRLSDNPALSAAVKEVRQSGAHLCPVFVFERYMTAGDPTEQFGYPQRFFLMKAIPAFAAHFAEFVLLTGNAVHAIKKCIAALKMSGYDPSIYVNDDVHPDFYAQIKALRSEGISITVFPDQMTVSKETKTGTGTLYSVFTPFKKAVWHSFLTAPVLPRVHLHDVPSVPASVFASTGNIQEPRESSLRDLFSTDRRFIVRGDAVHTLDCSELVVHASNFDDWYFSEREAEKVLSEFCSQGLAGYATRRDSLALSEREWGTSRMSLALTWGLLSARSVRARIQETLPFDYADALEKNIASSFQSPVQYLSELVWREFYKYVLFHRPSVLSEEFQEKYRGAIEWVPEKEALARFRAWIRGETGYPLVDAAMMQIAKTGWMHNRARMIVASVLTKNLGVDWRWGQEYFRAQLIDLDEASNNGGWQWAASVGADPKPIRIFNPYLQAAKFDWDDAYQKRWLGDAYGRDREPIIAHAEARKEALRRYGLSRVASRARRYGTGK